ncbi:MAG: type II toxin-antitoxin system prevent-host-death family antitoxin [Candidatus Sumerlaeota bacterium]|nr:type II toxin-antitoxin system prevent-host-death family antitoxin [Candidatus Sumerlaeota bacterium]
MRTATFTELRQHAKTYFDAVEDGEAIRVLRHGKPVADIVPVAGARRTPFWKRPALRLRIPGASLSKAVIREREESDR